MIYLIIGLIGMMYYRGKSSMSFILFTLMLVSAVSAFVVGRQHTFDVTVLGWTLFNSILLVILFTSFGKYSDIKSNSFENINTLKIKSAEKIVLIAGIIAIIISLYVLYNLNIMVSAGIISAEAHKNGGEGTATLNKIVNNHWLLTITYLLSPTGYISLFFHFYYLLQKNYKKAIIHIFLSLNIVTVGMMGLSRSSTITYVLLYGSMFYFFRPLIDAKIKKKMYFISILFMIFIGGYLTLTTTTRFEDHSYFNITSKNKPIVNPHKNPVLYSVFDYSGQWQEYAPKILDLYTPGDQFWGMYNSCGLAVQLTRYIYPRIDTEIDSKLERIMGFDRIMFHGVVARLVYDFGIVGAILFIFVYAYIVKKLAPKAGILVAKKAIFYPVIIPFPLMFFCGNAFSGIALNLAVIYCLLLSKYIKK